MNHYALAYREQQQLFMFDKAWIFGTLFKVGGLAALLAQFIVQFFWNPTLALILTLLLLALSGYLLWVAVRGSRKDWRIIPLCLLPACFIGASLSDNSLHFDYLTAILLVETGLVIFKRVHSYRVLWGVILTIILYFTAGPAAILFALCVASRYRKKGFLPIAWFLLLIAVAAACGVAAFFLAVIPTWAAAFTPVFFYDLDATMPAIHWAPWIAFLVVFLLTEAIIGHRTDSTSPKRERTGKTILIGSLIIFLASLFYSGKIARNFDRKSQLTTYEYEYYTVNDRWDELIAACRHHEWTPGTANYLNLALAMKGQLTEDLFKYDQRGVTSLTFMSQGGNVDVRLAHIMFAMGNMAAAQDISFNILNSLTGYCPNMLKMNSQIELMRGNYTVADKYLSMLEKSLRYRKWAKDQRRFLWNDSAVEADPVLGTGRMDFPKEDGFAMFSNPLEELMRVVEANPSDKKAMEYALSFLLLAKDMDGLVRFVDRYWGAPALQQLPEAAQEALIFYSEYSRNIGSIEPISLEWCLYHGVTESTARRFQAFQQASLQNGGKSPSGYKGTFWNYLLYTEI